MFIGSFHTKACLMIALTCLSTIVSVLVCVITTRLLTISDQVPKSQSDVFTHLKDIHRDGEEKGQENRSNLGPQTVDTVIRENPGVRTYLHIFDATEETEEDRNSINANKCVPMKTSLGPTPICIYDPKIDVHVSGLLVRSGMWEWGYINLMLSFFKANPDMQLLDLGSNVGVYTLQAAKVGRKVVAVDANKFNLRLLSKSLNLGGLQKGVTLVWNAVTDVHETINLTITTGNIGGSYVKSNGEVDIKPNPKFAVQQVKAITLDDLIVYFKHIPLFIKIDIQGSEWEAFRGGEIFLQEVNVRYILMEWEIQRTGDNGREFIRFMSNFGFQPYEPNAAKKKLNAEQSESWPFDVLWIKDYI